MSGGYLTVLDRAGREAKQYDLRSGLVTLGSSSSCDIRFMLSTVEPHHATVVVHDKQTVVHNVGGGETLVNGASVSVAPLAHGDVLTVGGRELRWRYARSEPHRARPASLTPVLLRMSRVRARVAARRSLAPPARPPRSPHRSSTPGGARQVAVVQPQRRDAAESSGKSKSPKATQINLQNTTKASMWIESRKTSPRRRARDGAGRGAGGGTPGTASSAHRSTPLRLAVLRRAQGAHRTRVTKIEAPHVIDHTKQAAIMLMTGHTPKKRPNLKPVTAKTPSLVVKRQGAAATARRPGRPRKHGAPEDTAPANRSRASGQTTPAAAATDATPRKILSKSNISAYSVTDTSFCSPSLPNPKKSALKDSSVKRSTRKVESIKFDLSNFEDGASNSVDIVTVSDAGDRSPDDSREELSLHYSDSSARETPSPRRPAQSRSGRILEKTLGTPLTKNKEHDASSPPPPPLKTPKKHSRGSVMVHKVLQTPDKSDCRQSMPTLSDRSSLVDTTAPSTYTTRTLSPRSCSKPDKMETYSVIDLVSMECSNSRSVYSSASDASSSKFTTPQSSARRSMRSLGAHCLLASSTPAAAADRVSPRPARSHSATGSRTYDSFQSSSCQIISRRSKSSASSPQNTEPATFNISGRGRCLSPPDVENVPQLTLDSTGITADNGKENVTHDMTTSVSTPDNSGDTFKTSDRSRQTKSFTTLKDTSRNVTLNSTTSSRISKSSLARANDEEMSSAAAASTPRGPERPPKSSAALAPPPNGMSTPENRKSPEEFTTPVLSIQSLLATSRNAKVPTARRTTGRRMSALGRRAGGKSKSFTFGATVSRLIGRNSNNVKRSANANVELNDGDSTPKKSVKLVYEAVKNKHSTAKRPKSIRSVIDNLNDSDIVQQLFNSPVKRKLSQSMMEYSKNQLTDDETAASPPGQGAAARDTVAVTGVTCHDPSPERSLERSLAITPDVFVSPLTAAGGDTRLVTLKLRQWRDRMTETNELHNATLGERSPHTPRQTHRKSVKNDLTGVSGIKPLFARSPRNRLTDVRIKQLYAASPKNDLTRISRLRLLFQESPKNDLRDVSGVRELFKKRSPNNDLREVSGVKSTMRRHSPRNELDDVRGVRDQFRREKRDDLNNISGIEELFKEQHPTSDPTDANAETSFDILVGRPAVRAYPKAKSFTTKLIRKPKSSKTRRAQSLHNSFNLTSDNVEDWLENELKKRMRKVSPKEYVESDASAKRQSDVRGAQRHKLNRSKTESNVSRELLKLATDTVAGSAPLLASRVRNSTLIKTSLNDAVELKRSASDIYGAHTLPIKKRSLVETSRNRSGLKNSLPIKKRMVKHSTPMKVSHGGAGDVTRNVSDLGCISPIALHGAPADLDADAARSMEQKTLKRRPVKNRNITVDDNIVSEITSTSKKLSPKNKEKIDSPVRVRSTRNRKTNHCMEQKNVKTRGSSIVITKKIPGLSPKPSRTDSVTAPKITRRRKLDRELQVDLTTKNTAQEIKVQKIDLKNVENPHTTSKKNKVGRKAQAVTTDRALQQTEESPPKTRGMRTRKASAQKVQTPKILSRTKVLKLSVVVTKPSPNLKTRTATRNKINESVTSPKKSLQRSRKAKADLNKTNKSVPPSENKNRGRRGAATGAKSNKAGYKINCNPNLRANKEDLDIDPMPRRGRRTVAQRNIQVENKAVNEHTNKKTRSKAAVAQEAVEPAKRRATVKQNSKDTVQGNKRKITGRAAPAAQSLGAVDDQDTNKRSSRRVTKGRHVNKNDVSGTTAEPRAKETRGGRNKKIMNVESVEKAVEPEAPRRTYTRRRAGERQPSGTGEEGRPERSSKEAARRRGADAALTAMAGRKRKAEADPSTAQAPPSPPKTRRAAAAAAAAAAGRKSPRDRAAAQRVAAQRAAAQRAAARR